MSTALGTVAELPAEYYDGLVGRNLLPLWPSLRSVLPYGRPARRTRPTLWKWLPRHRAAIAAGPTPTQTDPLGRYSGKKSPPWRDILDFQGRRHVEGRSLPPSIQNDSGLPQGFAGRPAAG